MTEVSTHRVENPMAPPTTNQELLIYWIRERYKILQWKLKGYPKPWSEDEVFQKTYFCNVRREDDKVTKWIRNYYSPYVDHPLFEYNILLSRFLNWPDTLEYIGYQSIHQPVLLHASLNYLAAERGKIWGNAYVITTHGIKMPKLQYLCRNVLPSAYRALERQRDAGGHLNCALTAELLQEIEGVGSFLSGQIVADLKNTVGHPLASAQDWWSFVTPGPGSIRGVKWYFSDSLSGDKPINFERDFKIIHKEVNDRWDIDTMGPRIHAQDLQNCLCEYDKYMRVRNGTGRSKRLYNGGVG